MLRNPFVAAIIGISVSLCLSGCSKSTKTATTEPADESAEKSQSGTDINSVKAVTGEGGGMKSPAKQSAGNGHSSLDPSTVTSRYLASLHAAINNAGALKTANEMLTSEARNATHLANVDVSLPGSPNAKYVVHQAEYVTNERNVAHVLTSWKDQVEGENYQYDVTWVLKNNPNSGWGVAGMITAGEDSGETIVFNFEDAADIVSKGVPDGDETQTAQKKSGEPNIR